MEHADKTRKGFRMPHTFVIIFTIILIAIAFTWLIPAGEYARFENAQGIKVIDPSQFNSLERTPVNPLLITQYIVNAFIKNADLIMVILFSGGAFHMLTKTGALQAVIAKLARRFSGHIGIFIPLLSLVFALICTTQAVNMFIAFAPVMVMLSLALGLSDEIQSAAGGIRLDTMFVDEGFGSLDEDTLNLAMKALGDLAEGRRLVGIISHVTELKERIERQIVVVKEKSGGSRARIQV